MNFKVYMTKGELATLMGVAAFGAMVRKLKAGALGETGLDIVEALDYTNGVYLDNPEITVLIPALVTNSIIDQPTADKVTAYVALQLSAPGATPELPPDFPAPPLVRSVSIYNNGPVPGGYEVKCGFVFSNGSTVDQTLTFLAEPTQGELDRAVTENLRSLNTREF